MFLEPTQGTHTLDLLLSNNSGKISSVEAVDGFPGADHDAVNFIVDLAQPHPSEEKRVVYDFKRADFEKFATS